MRAMSATRCLRQREKAPTIVLMKYPTRIIDFDCLAYTDAHKLQLALVDLKHSVRFDEILLMLEHEPVFTMGRRSQDSEILASEQCLREQGISVHRIERGGLITYHGPGQLVVYTIFDLDRMRLGVGDLVFGMEAVILDTLSEYGIQAQRIEGYRGIWVANEKIASIGIAVRKGITFHGLALNYDPNFEHFAMINPCGLDGVDMTSVSKILKQPVNPTLLRNTMASQFSRIFGLDLRGWSIKDARETLASAS